MMIIVPLLMIVFSGIFAQLAGNVVLSDDFGGAFSGTGNINQGISGTYNGTDYDYEVESQGLYIDTEAGLWMVVVGTVALICVVGIAVFGSGMSDVSVKAVLSSAGWYGFWILFSVLASAMFNAIPLFGWALYIFMTLIFSLGVMGSMME